tara:strand:- start:37 stop:228 length:192 start_codon:yes stop_codon:yes gene_type:complete
LVTKKNVQGVIRILTLEHGLGLLLIGSVITIIGFYIGYNIGMPKVKTKPLTSPVDEFWRRLNG